MSNPLPMLTIDPKNRLLSFSQMLCLFMQRHQVSVDELALRLSVRRSTIQRWMSGEVRRPRQREDVLRCATYLSLTFPEQEALLMAAGFTASPRLSLPIAAMPTPIPPHLSIHLGQMCPSPFVIGPPITEPRQFFGRDYLLHRIFDVWKYLPLQHIAIVGAKRSGKTSLLHYLRRIIDTPPSDLRPGQRNNWLMPGYQWVFVDFQDPRMCHQESLLRHILIELNLPVPEPCQLVDFMEIMQQYLEIPTLILLDEISAGLLATELNEQFWWALRTLGSHYANGKLGFVLTTHRPPEELILDDGKPSPFFNIFGHVLSLGPLLEKEARDLIASSPLPFSAEDVEWILTQSGCWPALVQILSHARLISLQEKHEGERWKKEGLRRMQPYQYLLHQELLLDE
jgi:hypothetical protein